MRAALMEGGDRLAVVDDIEVEDPRPGEVMVRVSHCGICHSDLSMLEMGAGMGACVLGHEAAGVVEAVGPEVRSVRPGDKVMLTPLAPCGHCYWCARSEHTACEEAMAFTTHLRPDGSSPFSRAGEVVKRGLGVAGFGELTVVGERGVVRLDEDTPLEIACVVGCAIQTGVGAVVNTAQVEPGATALVLGMGGIGISVVQGLRLSGAARIVVSDPVAERREAARHFGATDVIDPTADDVGAKVMADTGDIGVDYAFEAAGVAGLVDTCIQASRRGGTTVIVGADASLATVEVMPVMLATLGKKIVGSLLGDCHPQRDIPRFVDAWRRGDLDFESMISHRLGLSEINAGFDHLRAAEGIRSVVHVGG